MANNFSMVDWSRDKAAVWETIVAKHGGNPEAINWGTWDFFDWAVGKGWATIGTVSKARKFGWTRYDDTLETWIQTFRSFENAGILPIQNPPPPVDVKSLPLRPNPAEAVTAKLDRREASVPLDDDRASAVLSDGEDKPVSLASEETRFDETVASISIDGTEKSHAFHVETVPGVRTRVL